MKSKQICPFFRKPCIKDKCMAYSGDYTVDFGFDVTMKGKKCFAMNMVWDEEK